ncbi:mitochondrial carrier domain-containing protein [Thamnocephalis sphaerospora]|uniref:Mitochondrial carrier domain-containing protein n=1 Tax=Thamnocephalis sphaerospora TaxID=78915 RepID=A0A4P9XU69_9FUNG|nr:mitochondrial carrier domain-containing protein [Thamnocephalis sphaerospora]|eukprot:RKP09764.1 mitochondrial carrier domain-containing protein [Thamnocephalis sphaerospora]
MASCGRPSSTLETAPDGSPPLEFGSEVELSTQKVVQSANEQDAAPLMVIDSKEDAQVCDVRVVADIEEKHRHPSASAGAASAVVRALILKPLYLWYKSPLKLFRPVRVDYLVMAKALAPRAELMASKDAADTSARATRSLAMRWRASTLGLLTNAVRQEGMSFIPRHVLPPLLANGACGAVLFTAYEGVQPQLERQWRAKRRRAKRAEPLQSAQTSTWTDAVPLRTYMSAGAVAGAFHAVVATPLDALQVRLEVRDFLSGRFSGFMDFAKVTARELGAGGLYRGFLFTLVKDMMGYAIFFGMFDSAKAMLRERKRRQLQAASADIVSPADVLLGTAAVLVSGAAAGAVYQLVDHPLDHIRGAVLLRGGERAHGGLYAAAWHRCRRLAMHAGGWRTWLYTGFGTNLIKAVPATSLGLFCYEMMKRRFEELEAFEYEDRLCWDDEDENDDDEEDAATRWA